MVGGLAGIPLTAGRAYAATQADWRLCSKCHGLFYSGPNCSYNRENQRCPAGDLHIPFGFNYVLEYDIELTSRWAQNGWRFCDKCNGLFYFGPDDSDRRPDQVCPGGGLHNAGRSNYVLTHDITKSLRGARRPSNQQDWRFCNKCYGLFYWGKDGADHRENQRCPAGDLHNPATDGYNYVLSYQPAPAVQTPPVQHFVEGLYVLPSDAADRRLAENGTLTRSVDAIQRWFSDRTCGYRLSIRPEIGTVRLDGDNDTDAEVATHGALVRDYLERRLQEMGFNDPQTMYAVWYDGTSNHACGGASWPTGVTTTPLQLRGHVAALYLRAAYDLLDANGQPVLDANGQPVQVNCANDQFTADGVTPAINEFKMLHEILHTMGLVHPNAPHHHAGGHTNDDPQDLLFRAPPGLRVDWRPSAIDPGNDDYFWTGRTDIIDLSRSVFLDPLPPDAQPPPGW
jgi:hypothetical protein